MNTEHLLNERQATHGDYCATAIIAQALKNELRQTEKRRTAAQNESLDMICSKLARIANGNPDEVDHWRDIAGYATLVVNALVSDRA